MMIAVTGDDEDNLVACQLAKYRFKVPRTVARLTNPKNETLFRMLGIDVTISSTDVIMEYIGQEVPTHLLTHLMTIQDRGVEIVEVKIPEGAKSIGRQVRDIRLPTGSMLMLIIRRDQRPLLPDQDTRIQDGDQIIALTATDTEDLLKTALQGG
jgi:trk system potassium uptake protein TrkA